jgi:hypothetical protein
LCLRIPAAKSPHTKAQRRRVCGSAVLNKAYGNPKTSAPKQLKLMDKSKTFALNNNYSIINKIHSNEKKAQVTSPTKRQLRQNMP